MNKSMCHLLNVASLAKSEYGRQCWRWKLP